MKNKLNYKKLIRILSLLLLSLALVLGIVFSSIKVNSGLIYGPEYKGAYEVSVQVKRNDNQQVDLDQASSSLQDKLSPFNDVPLTINKKGKNHLQLIASKTAFNNNSFNLRQQIESGGGMFILSRDLAKPGADTSFSDFYSDKKVLEAAGQTGIQRLRTNMIFDQEIKSESLANGTGRSPYIGMSLQKAKNSDDYVLQKIISSALTSGQNGQVPPQLFFVTDLEALINELRYFYTLDETNIQFLRVYYDAIIRPAQTLYDVNNQTDTVKTILRNLFGGTITYQNPGTNLVLKRNISLIDKNYNLSSPPVIDGVTVAGTNSFDDLRKILTVFEPFEEANASTSNFIYSTDLTTGLDADIKQLTLGANSNSPIPPTIHKQDAFNTTVNFFMNKVLFPVTVDPVTKENVSVLNEKITKLYSPIKNNFIYNGYNKSIGPVIAASSSMGTVNLVQSQLAFFTPGSDGNGSTSNKINAGFYIPTDTLTTAKKAVASIKQNTSGIVYSVESISEQKASISHVAYIVSLTVLSIIALALLIFLLFVYRLMGLFTILIAATTAALLLLAGGVGFHIVMGPQFICALFLIIGFVVDINVILFDSFIENFYQKKHGMVTSFRISNKETWSIAIDALIVTIIPSVVLFWVGNGEVKNFATLVSIGVFLAIILALFLARIIYWLLMKSKFILDNPWLLPINTNLTTFKTAREQYLISIYEQYLEKMDKKTKYRSKELIRIKRVNDKLADLRLAYATKGEEYNKKVAQQEKKALRKMEKRRQSLKDLKIKFLSFFKIKGLNHFVGEKFDEQIDDMDHLIVLSREEMGQKTNEKDEETKESIVVQTAKVYKKTRFVNRFGIVLTMVIILVGIIAGIVGGTVGPNYSTNYGKGQSFVLYDNGVNDAYDRVLTKSNWTNEKIVQLSTRLEAEDTQWRATHSSPDQDPTIFNNHRSAIVGKFLEYVIDHKLYIEVTSQAVDINLKKNKINLISNYTIDENNEKITTFALEVTSNSTNERSRSQFKKFLRFVAYGQWINNNDGTSNEQIASYTLEPYTGSEQLRDIGIVIGIMLVALLVYMIIRFKWTYYVALALGLVLTIGTVFALAVIFRIPVSVELLSGIAFLITFSLITMMLVLGKGKNILNAEHKDTIYHNFDKEIEASIEIRQYRYDRKQRLNALKKELKILRKQFNKTKAGLQKDEIVNHEDFQTIANSFDLAKTNYQMAKKMEKDNYREFKTTTDRKINEHSRRNLFFKNLYGKLIDFSVWRMAIPGLFFLVTALVLTVTMPSIFSLGLIILIGLIVGGMVSLFIVVPVWVFFEKKRIRDAYAYKEFVRSLKVSSEEQIVKGIND